MSKSSTTILFILLISFIFIFISFDFVLADYTCECINTGTSRIYNFGDFDDCMMNCESDCFSLNVLCTEIVEDSQPDNPDDPDLLVNPDKTSPINPDIPEKKTTGGKQSAKLSNPLGTKSIPVIIGNIIKTFLGIIGTISLVMFIYGGLLMLTSAGKPGQIQRGQQTLVWASLGILVVFTSYAILRFVFSAFGL
ncbi:pilin [Candidatus Parcubacteria bacterium]|nr:pilin [Candidatus Parcubacteria bacterium]